jgi:4-diphosphocytidyl-2-C-methyl-D-erythritol kinase
MITFPKAKINLGLRITGKRPDGFHDIETIFYPTGFCDALEFVPLSENVKEDTIVVTGFNIGIRPEKNLVIRAFRKLREHFTIPFFKIHLHKAIPSGSGLGGGSSDAACILRTINKYFSLEMDNEMLKSLALELGSDCPFFIDSVPSLATGRGEILKPVSKVLYGYHLVLVKPGVRISTREAYINTHPAKPKVSLEYLINQDISEWKKYMVNDFEEYAFKLYPQISEYKTTLYRAGAVFSSMSGSGSTVYGIFEGKPELPEDIRKFVIYEGLL